MKKKLIERLKKVSSHPAFGFLSKHFDKIILTAGVIDARKDFLIAFNNSQPLGHRVIAFSRGSCCTVSLVSAYFAEKSTDPILAARFRVCCVLAITGYMFAGGDIKLALAFRSVSNPSTLAI